MTPCTLHPAGCLLSPLVAHCPEQQLTRPPACLPPPLQDFNSTWHAFASMFAYLLAMFDYSVLYGSSNPNAAMVLFMVFEFIMNVMMLNILIAVMTNSFAKVSEGEALRFLRHRAEVGGSLAGWLGCACVRTGAAAAAAALVLPCRGLVPACCCVFIPTRLLAGVRLSHADAHCCGWGSAMFTSTITMPSHPMCRRPSSATQIIDELESTLPRWVQGPSWHPPFLHLLKLHPEATYEVSLSSVWSGIGAMERNLLGGQAEVALQVGGRAGVVLGESGAFAVPAAVLGVL